MESLLSVLWPSDVSIVTSRHELTRFGWLVVDSYNAGTAHLRPLDNAVLCVNFLNTHTEVYVIMTLLDVWLFCALQTASNISDYLFLQTLKDVYSCMSVVSIVVAECSSQFRNGIWRRFVILWNYVSTKCKYFLILLTIDYSCEKKLSIIVTEIIYLLIYLE